MVQKRILVHGHRGARAVRPENTLPAFEYAIAVGVDVLELDMAVTKDNVIVVSHDPRLHEPMCTGPRNDVPIRELSIAEVRQYDCGARKNPLFPKQLTVPGTHMPTLDDVFALASRGRFDFNIETKIFAKYPELTPSPEEFAKLVLNRIRAHKLERRVILQSFDYRTLHAMKKLAPEIRLSALFEGEPRSFVKTAQEAQATIVSPRYNLVTKEEVAAAHKAKLQVVPWTPNTPSEWDKLIAADVDAIISDDPAELIRHLASYGRTPRP
jgi:glycerophosphoryl diester phosphodiesterase